MYDSLPLFYPWFVLSYVASASDGCGLNSAKPIKNHHKTISDRVAAANCMIKDLNFVGEVICDSMANEVLSHYHAHPERILIIQDGRIVHIGGAGPLVFYDIDDVMKWLSVRDFRPKVSGDVAENSTEPECST
jgi:hypothetical protein